MSEGKVVEAKAPQTLHDFDPQKKPKRNMYAFACAMLASMTSILLGYGNYTTPSHLFNLFIYSLYSNISNLISKKRKKKSLISPPMKQEVKKKEKEKIVHFMHEYLCRIK